MVLNLCGPEIFFKWKIKSGVQIGPSSTFIISSSFGLCEPPNLSNLASLRGGLGELGTHGDGIVGLHVPSIATLLQVPFFPLLFLFFFFFNYKKNPLSTIKPYHTKNLLGANVAIEFCVQTSNNLGISELPPMGGNGGSLGCYNCYCCTYMVLWKREKERREGEGKYKEIKPKKQQKRAPCDQTMGLLLVCFLKNFVVILTTFQFQGLGFIWVQLPKKLYMKNKYKNIVFAKIHEQVVFAPQAKLLHKQLVIIQKTHNYPTLVINQIS